MALKKSPQLDIQLQQKQRILDFLLDLSYRTGEPIDYLQAIAQGVSKLVSLDWSVVTLCQNGVERVMASTVDMGEGEHIYDLHGLVTNTVITTGQSLAVDDVRLRPECGQAPEGYLSYLGVPLRTSQKETIGTICSFCHEPRLFTPEEIATVEIFAERAATALDNYLLYQKQKNFNHMLEEEVAKRTAQLQAAQAQLMEVNAHLEEMVEQRTAELRRSLERLAEIGGLAAKIVHEVRNPLTTILLGLNSFKRLELPEAAQMRLELSLDEGDRLKRLLDEILNYAKQPTLQMVEIELNKFIAEMVDSIRALPSAQDRQIEFIPASSEVVVDGDRDKLKQIFVNLINNACEAIAVGNTVRWEIDDRSAPDRIYVKVHNGGTPIPPEVIPKLTEPFYSTKPSGTGLGLGIVQSIVIAHGGDLSIQSSEEMGTVVSFYLPRSDVSQ
ncbi:GAF domain-containing sensor histidine kinase [Pseudanabaena sp. PCC 6802]|uniref:GAF domain-containing sensor histidine kinase n=1 Tax=Pseudanabaena sp. PCC 6802 TaxID=118173 RepID=UPI000346D203|nr:GAF domain-containing sensor histidine kinase [Pseudanabaena sp. PCC 6802]